MTVTPAAANRGDWAREVVAPAENSAMSSPVGSASAASSTTMSCPAHGSVEPADRAEAKNRICSTGKFRSARILRITPPTCPVAPTTPMRKPCSLATSRFLRTRRRDRPRRDRMPCATPALRYRVQRRGPAPKSGSPRWR